MKIYDWPIYIVVQSKHAEMLQTFKETFLPTTRNFKNLYLAVEDGEEYGAKVINEHIIKARDEMYNYFGVFNDDLWFAAGWLENVMSHINEHWVIAPGYVETTDEEVFRQAVIKTKDEEGFVLHPYGPTSIFRMDLFRKIGIFDERYDWSCDDLDWSLRLHLNGLSGVTLKRITTAHFHGQTRTQNNKEISAWWALSNKNKRRFYDKNGYENYRFIRSSHLNSHKYFGQFK
jgi:GT2 family glycosyltransferase